MRTIQVSGSTPLKIVAAADLNGDGIPDLIWRNPSGGAAQAWLMGGSNGATYLSTAQLSSGNPWTVVAAAPTYTRAEYPLLMWQQPSGPAVQYWQMTEPSMPPPGRTPVWTAVTSPFFYYGYAPSVSQTSQTALPFTYYFTGCPNYTQYQGVDYCVSSNTLASPCDWNTAPPGGLGYPYGVQNAPPYQYTGSTENTGTIYAGNPGVGSVYTALPPYTNEEFHGIQFDAIFSSLSDGNPALNYPAMYYSNSYCYVSDTPEYGFYYYPQSSAAVFYFEQGCTGCYDVQGSPPSQPVPGCGANVTIPGLAPNTEYYYSAWAYQDSSFPNHWKFAAQVQDLSYHTVAECIGDPLLTPAFAWTPDCSYTYSKNYECTGLSWLPAASYVPFPTEQIGQGMFGTITTGIEGDLNECAVTPTPNPPAPCPQPDQGTKGLVVNQVKVGK
jgi:hypothetical protein